MLRGLFLTAPYKLRALLLHQKFASLPTSVSFLSALLTIPFVSLAALQSSPSVAAAEPTTVLLTQNTPSSTPEPETTPEPESTSQPESSNFILQQEGELTSDDPVFPIDRSPYDEYTFEGRKGQSVTITLESSNFDTYLMLVSPDDELLEENDDIDNNNTNSSLTVTLPSSGSYRAIVNAFDKKGRGRYTIGIR